MIEFEKRVKALKKGLDVFVAYDERERLYKYDGATKGENVEYKGKNGFVGRLQYSKSEDAKEALLHGWDITKDEYEDGTYIERR